MRANENSLRAIAVGLTDHDAPASPLVARSSPYVGSPVVSVALPGKNAASALPLATSAGLPTPAQPLTTVTGVPTRPEGAIGVCNRS